MEEIKLAVELRKYIGGKGNLSSTRNQKKIPGVVYGGKGSPVAVSIHEKDLLKVLKGGANIVIKMQYPGGADTVILKDMQRHVVTGALLHVDFHRISLTEKIEVKVPLKLTGESIGVKTHDGLMEHSLRELKVRCLPAKIPKELPIDISNLDVGATLLVKDVKAPEGVEILDDAEHIIVTVVVPEEEEEPAAVPGEAEAEPEVIAKGKKEEEAGAVEEKGPAGKPQGAKPQDAKPGGSPSPKAEGKEAAKPQAEKK